MRGFRERTTVEDAVALLERRTTALATESVAVRDAAGRVAAEEVRARVPVPHFARATMDGWAVVGESTFGATTYSPASLRVVGDARPGRPYSGAIRFGEAVAIATGAPVPDGADAVLMAEHGERVGTDAVRVSEPVPPGKHVGRVGEDVQVGDVVVRKGRVLRPQDAGVLASVGVAAVAVVRRPTVRVLTTGDELMPPGSAPEGSRIVDSNGVVLDALCRRDGVVTCTTEYVRDGRAEVEAALAAAREDVVLVSGGSSVGPEDHAPRVLSEIGELAVHGVAMRPSSPAGFGFLGARPVFLLPGNPVSCLCAYEFFAGPTIRALGGLPRAWPHARRSAPLASKIVSELGRVDYVRVKLDGDRVAPVMTSGASILSSTTIADGVVIVGADREGYREGETVTVLLYDPWGAIA